ncbi:MAG: hypothetical protein Q4C48_00220 [Lachnospiraceae bacterium]|nr:hypothetical protein [Lachnospiraceae bacterium]
MKLEYILIGAAIAVGIVLLAVWDRRREKNRLLSLVRERWGKPGSVDPQEIRLRTINAYLESLPKRRNDVDGVTWNDLDLDRVFTELNTTFSAVGEEYLYALLHRPETEAGPLAEFEERVRFFSERERCREELAVSFARMGKLRAISLYGYLSRIADVRPESNLRHFALLLGYAAGLLCFPFGYGMWGVWIVLTAALCNILSYYQRKGEIEPYLLVFSYLLRWLQEVERLEKTDAAKEPPIAEDGKELRAAARVFSGFRRGASLLTPASPTGSLLDMIMDYVRMLFHVDLIKFNSMYRFFLGHQKELDRLFFLTGRLDAALAVASYRQYKQTWCEPVLRAEGAVTLRTSEMYHPLIAEPVKNSIDAKRPVLLTGSNASGKSTFLKMVALNAVFAQTIHTVLADSYESRYMHVLSSMALRDDLELGESYYIVEIKSLKRILDAADGTLPVLCFVDEVLRGTNTAERIAASSRILADLAGRKALPFAATHDLELTDILASYYDNYHFSEQIVGQDVVFDYRLRRGKAVSRNAIRLLAMLSYPEHIIRESEKTVERFLITGDWEKL